MTLGHVVQLLRSSVLQILILAAPVLLIGMLVGLIVSILQATTSIQEQTLTFVPKIVAIMLALLFFGPWMFGVLVVFTENIFAQIPGLVR
ncbi:MAG: flagellar biosynthetic protein FliQ [Spirochaetaceae bacterium]|nr:MAG: flagellar biosynthetic protein FliQ [Spirochaetaceae bacterium]